MAFLKISYIAIIVFLLFLSIYVNDIYSVYMFIKIKNRNMTGVKSYLILGICNDHPRIHEQIEKKSCISLNIHLQ